MSVADYLAMSRNIPTYIILKPPDYCKRNFNENKYMEAFETYYVI